VRRRDVLALAALPALAGCRFDLSEGLTNRCRVEPNIANHPLVRTAWNGLRADRVWDCHVHLFGNGKGDRGVHVEKAFDSPKSPAMIARRRFFMNAGCVGEYDEGTDARMVTRLAALAEQMPAGAKVMLLAFDLPHGDDGHHHRHVATFGITNEYARRVAASKPDRFEWICSIHPYRPDAVATLEACKRDGARAVKWLPPSMGIDMASPLCRPFYEAARRLDIPLLIHVGEELAAPGAEKHDYANPLLLRHPLEAGVRVIAAHCATLGEAADLDANPDAATAPRVTCFDLFKRLMADRNYEKRLFGDISAITQANRPGAFSAILEMEAWDGRLLNGSDYPLPGVLPLFSLKALVAEGVLDAALIPALREVRHANALLFDFVLKRHLKYRGRGFSAKTFETRDFFQRSLSSPGEGRS
jgi:predicted TIM-barrel fold metal-dependent hydrolase